MGQRVFLGMSGGVDSSVSAIMLQRAGYDVSGVNLRMFPGAEADGPDARAVAAKLGLPFHVYDFSEIFRETVIADFVSAYEAGRTPNPCVVCNRRVKFGALLQRTLALGGDFLATGHYARVEWDGAAGRWLLKRGADRSKDQSYFLYTLTQDQLSHILFPLGGLHKTEVRQIAAENGLVNAKKRDSQDLCFVPDGDYAAFIERIAGRPSPAGEFVDEAGRVLGRHRGFVRYTRGQHKGLGLSIEPPLYVLDKDPETKAVRLGPDAALWTGTLTAEALNWISIPAPAAPIRAAVKTRYSQKEAAATLEPLEGGGVRVVFDEPQRAVTPGQAAVFYQGDAVVGGGTIAG